MARIVCQVLLRPEQVTFIWSQEQAFFEPYHLMGQAAEQFHGAAQQASDRLAEVLQGSPSQEMLARAGHELYRFIFRSEGTGVGRKVENWLGGLEEQGAIDSLEIVSDVPGRIPWNVVYSEEPSGPPNLAAFWGVRYPLTTGRRVNPLRLNPIMSEPDVLLVLDPGGAAAEQAAWHKLAADHSWRTVTMRAELTTALDQRCPDVLCWVGAMRNGSLALGAETIGLAELKKQIDGAKDGSLEPLLLLQSAASEDAHHGLKQFLEQAALTFPGLIGWQTAAAPSVAGPIGRDLLEDLLSSGKQLGQVLRDLRRNRGYPALALAAFCPPQMCLADAEVPPTGVLYQLPEEPYPALRPLDREDRPLLGGRDRDIFRFTSLLDQPAGKLLVLHGAFGAGKASFLRAGVIPFLEDDNRGYLALRNRSTDGSAVASESEYPVLAVRATRDLVGQFAEALCVFCDQAFRCTTPLGTSATVALPELLRQAVRGGKHLDTSIQASPDRVPPEESAADFANSGDPVGPVELWQALEKDPNLLGKLLESLSHNLPQDLLILIEQGEELITLARDAADEQRRRRALDMLVHAARQAPRCKIVLSLRTEFLGRLLAEFPGDATDHVREYLLPELNRDQLMEVLLLPTANEAIPFTDEIPHQKYRIIYAETFAGNLVDQVIEEAAMSRQSAVALLQAVAARLHARARSRNLMVVGDAELKLGGGVAGVIKNKVDNRLQAIKLPKRTKQSLRNLLTIFCTAQPDGTVTRDLYTLEETLNAWQRRDRAEAQQAVAAAEEAGLLESQHLLIDGDEDTYVSLPNDSLARVAQDWNDEGTYDQPAWKRGMIDTLWVTIPLICVAAALTHFFTRRYFAGEMEINQTVLEKLDKENKRLGTQAHGLGLAQYVGSLRQAEDAWQSGNMVRMRQVLLTQQVKTQRQKSRERGEEDLRGFEWYYLWQLANSEKSLLQGHEAPVAAVAVSPDSGVLASGSLEGKLFLWDANGRKRATLQGHAGAVNALAFSSDGKWLISAGEDKTIRLWKASDGKDAHVYVDKPEKSLTGHTAAVLALAVHQKVLVSAGADKSVIVWDLDKGTAKHTLKEHSAAVNALAIAPFGSPIASGDASGKIHLWDADTGKKQRTIDAATGSIRALAFAHTDKFLLSGGSEANGSLGSDQDVGAIRVWNTVTGEPHTTPKMTHATDVFALSFSPDYKVVASAGKDHFVRLWDAASYKELGAIKGHLGWVRSLAFAPDGKSLVSGSFDSDVKVWQPRPTSESDVLTPGKEPLASVVISPDDKYLAAAGKDGNVYLWSLASSKLLHTITGLKGPVTSLSFGVLSTGKGVHLAAACRVGADEGLVQAWKIKEAKDGKLAAEESLSLPTRDRTVESLAFSPDGKKLAWGGSLKKDAKTTEKAKDPAKVAEGEKKHVIEIWDVEGDKQKPTTKLSGDLQTVRSLAFNPSNELLAVGGSDNQVWIWHLEAGIQVPGSPFEGHGAPVLGVSFVQTALMSASADGTVRVWLHNDKAQFHPLWVYRGQAGPVNAIVASGLAGGKQHVSAGADRAIHIWQNGLGDRFTLRGHTGPIRALAVSADGLTLASTGDDGTVRVWRAAAPKAE